MTSPFNFENKDPELDKIFDTDNQLPTPENLKQDKSSWSTEPKKLLNQVIQNFHQAVSEEEVLTISVEEAQKLLDCDRVVIYSLTEESQGKVIAEAIIPGWTKILGMIIADPCLKAGYIGDYQNGQVKIINNLYIAGIDKGDIEQLEALEVKANLVAPLLKQGKLFGLLVAHQCSQPRIWQSEEIALFSQLAIYAGFSLNSTNLLAESNQLKQQEAIENQWTQFFTDAVRHIRQSLQQKDILDVSVEEVRRVLGCDRVVIYSLNQDKYGTIIAESVAPGWTKALGITIEDPCFETQYLEQYQNGRVRALDNIYAVDSNPCYLEQLEQLEVKANLVTPLINEDKLFGLLVAHQCDRPRSWQQQEIRWLTQIATQVGFALDNAKLLAESAQIKQQQETEAQWTQFFTDTVNYIRQSLQQKDILDITVKEVRRVLDCDRVVIYSLNQENYGVVIAESVALGCIRALGITIEDPCFETKYLEQYQNGRVRALDNIYEAEITPCYLAQLEKLAVKANLVTPIINEGKIFGLLVAHQCDRPRTWQQHEIRWLTQIATQVGFALDNAKLLAESTHLQQQVDNENQWMQSLKDFVLYLRPYSQQLDILEMTVDEARRVLNCDRVLVYSLNRDYYGEVIAESVIPGCKRALGLIINDPCFETKYMKSYQNGRVKSLDNIYAAGLSACYLEQLEQLEVKANLVTPIIIEDKIFGLLVAHYCNQPHQWRSIETRFLSQLSVQVGLQLERGKLIDQQKQLEAQAENEVQWTNLFTQAVQNIRQSLNQSHILDTAVQEVQRALRCDRVVVYSLNHDQYGKVVAESVAPGFRRVLGKVIKDPCFEARYIEKYRDGRVRAIDNIYEAGITSCYLEQLEKLEVKANLVTPLLNEDKLFGILVAHQCAAPRHWKHDEIRWMTQIATQVGFALDNAKLLQQLEQSFIRSENMSSEEQQQKEALKQQLLTILNESMSVYQTLSQEALQQSEKVIDVLHRIQGISDSIRGQVVEIQNIKLEEQQNTVKIEILQKTLNQTITSIATIDNSINNAAVRLRNLQDFSPKLLEGINLIQNLGKSIAQKTMKATIAMKGTEQISENSLTELTDTVFSSMQQIYEGGAQINPLLSSLEKETREGLISLDSSLQKIAQGMNSFSELQQKLNQITTANTKISTLVGQIANSAHNQIQVSTSARQSVQEVANLANQISTHSLAINDSFNRITALLQEL